jgi:hypothetical protein
MRHVFVATAFVLIALVITFGTASVLQEIATARRVPATNPEPAVVAEPVKTTPVKARSEQARQAILAARRAG